MDIAGWLDGLGLGEYKASFKENAVEADVLPDLTPEDLKEIGVVAVGHRRRILAAIDQLKSAPPEKDHDPSLAEGPTDYPGGERRHVAVVFADLVGYVQLTKELGAEGTHALLDAFFSRVDAIVERTGGRIDKHIGDCVMGVFGAPVAHDNDAERAVQAALDICTSIKELSIECERDLNVHIGITTGSVVASYLGAGAAAEYTVTGDSVNLASRLCNAAGTGEILISDGLFQTLKDKLVCETVDKLKVKGLTEPVQAWRLIALREERSRQGRFVGRRSELRQFGSMLHSCREESAGQIVYLRGEAGIGKSRLSGEFEGLALEAGFASHLGLILDFGVATGRDAFSSIVRQLLGIEPSASGDTLHKATRDAVERGIIEPAMQVHLNNLLGAAQPDELRPLYEAMDFELRQEGAGATIASIIGWATVDQPRLLVVEDIHWAKASMLKTLAQIARAVADCRAILVMTSRFEGDPLDRSWRATVAGTPFMTVDLSPLRTDEARLLCQAGEIEEQALIDSCVERSAGNPLFLEQLIRHSHDESPSAVPGTIQSLVQARVDRLAKLDKQAIQTASVVGQRVDLKLLRFLIGDHEFDPVGLVSKNLLRPHGKDYLFGHALIRDAIYEALLSSTRIALHQRAADWFKDRDHLLHAEHLELAGSSKAPTAFLRAAREEIANYHYEAGLGLIERGLSMAAIPEDQIVLQILRGETLHNLGHMGLAEEAYRISLDIAPTDRDRCCALIGLAAAKRVTDDIDGALENLEHAQNIAATDNLLAERSQIHFMRGNLLFPRGDFDGCLREHETALEFAKLAERPDLEAACLGGLGDAEYVQGRMVSARHRLEECVELAGKHGLGRTEVANQAQIAHTIFYSGTQQEALDKARAAIEAALRIGHARAEINARIAVAKSLLCLERYDECLNEYDRLEPVVLRLGASRFWQSCYLIKGRALHELGKPRQALEILQDGLESARKYGFGFHGPSLWSTMALVKNDHKQKIEALEKAEASIAQGCVGHNQFWVYADGITVAHAIADPALLLHFTKLLEAYPAGENVAWSQSHATRGHELLARLGSGSIPQT